MKLRMPRTGIQSPTLRMWSTVASGHHTAQIRDAINSGLGVNAVPEISASGMPGKPLQSGASCCRCYFLHLDPLFRQSHTMPGEKMPLSRVLTISGGERTD